ncbi:MAG TPA: hypothetical protein VNW29_02430 [Candidatus Sulfotelmatobacter sp.]|jgi:predicted GH43/DUF377 family glycosyl hydrolase|nr:hypothetical protein [Candidatus Sulfotelmatobacter sp.]
MVQLQRHSENPILSPNMSHEWEHDGAFNGCVAYHDGIFHMVYRALSSDKQQNGVTMRVSTVGYATSTDGIHFSNQRLLFGPTEDWEIYGVEDPRITYFNGKFYIFYTALSVYPFSAYGIKTAVAITEDFKTFHKHPVSTFNAKAMALFPDLVKGKMGALITMNTDLPPAKIGVAYFDREEDMWSPYYWDELYENSGSHVINLLRDIRDQVELGSAPIKTKDGWLVLYSYITDYLSNEKKFGIEAVLLDIDHPRHILGRTQESLLTPQAEYELRGDVPNVIFPSGGLVKDDELYVYYGAADTHVGLATCKIKDVLDEIRPKATTPLASTPTNNKKLVRYEGNPILTPIIEWDWQSKAVFNPAAIYEDDKVHLIYRAQARDGMSVFGYAVMSRDGFHIEENLDYPIYIPREDFEKRNKPEGNAGCEDPRITEFEDRFYMTYTAYDGENPPRVAMTWIGVEDFLRRQWNWAKPKLISLPNVDDKDACIIKNRNGKYIVFHRLGNDIWVDISDKIDNLGDSKFLDGQVIAQPRQDKWDNVKIGISAPPIETEHGFLLLYHGVSEPGFKYKVGAMLLDAQDPTKVLARTDEPIFEPEMPYEIEGEIPNVVFPCGALIIDKNLFVYYGGADKVIGVATIKFEDLLNFLLKK